jgi:hypothetical protein
MLGQHGAACWIGLLPMRDQPVGKQDLAGREPPVVARALRSVLLPAPLRADDGEESRAVSPPGKCPG